VGYVPYVVVESCGVQVREGQGPVKIFKEECREGVWSGYGEFKLKLGVVNIFRYLERGDSFMCQKSGLVTIYM